MTLPVSDALTIGSSPCASANMAMINSAALPKVAFRSPPSPGPTRQATASVASPIKPASGMIATAARKNSRLAGAPVNEATTVTGTKTSNSRTQPTRLGSSQSRQFARSPPAATPPPPSVPLTRPWFTL